MKRGGRAGGTEGGRGGAGDKVGMVKHLAVARSGRVYAFYFDGAMFLVHLPPQKTKRSITGGGDLA